MTDVFTKEKRSQIMSRIRSKSGLDRRVHNWLCGRHIRHEMHPEIVGNPDVRIMGNRGDLYLFNDGCFWHMCPIHYRRPKSNQEFWIEHIEVQNAKREAVRRNLPYRWIRLWEHEIYDGGFRGKIRLSLAGVG